MSVEASIRGNSLVVVLSGRLAGEECNGFREAVRSSLKNGIQKAYLDLRAVTFIDSNGLGTLVGVKTMCRANGTRIALVAPGPDVMQELQRVQFDLVFEIIDEIED